MIALKAYSIKKSKLIFWLLFIAVTIFIFANSAKPAIESSEQSGFYSEILLKYFGAFFENESTAVVLVRKAAHFTEFFAQSFFLSAALFSPEYRKRIIYVLFTGLLTACTDEFIQLFFDGRGSQVSDVFIDFSGACFAVWCFVFFGEISRRHRKKEGK